MANKIITKVIEGKVYPLRQMLEDCPKDGCFRGKGKLGEFCKLVQNIGKCPYYSDNTLIENPEEHKNYHQCLS